MGTLNDALVQQLRSIRTQKEISIESIAKQLGMSSDNYSKIENGETTVTLDSLEDIAKALDVTSPELLGMSSTIIAPVNINAEIAALSGANSSPYSNINYFGVSTEVLEKLLNRIEALENALAKSRK